MVVSTHLLDSVVKHEGFKPNPYQDHLGNWTIGHGFTWLDEEESLQVLRMRLIDIQIHLESELLMWKVLPIGVKDCLTEMSFQMGVSGVLNFRNMLHAMAREEWIQASEHGMDSKWARQTPLRATEMMLKLANTNI